MDDTVEACLSDGAAVHLIVRPDAWTLREAWRVQDAWRWSHLLPTKILVEIHLTKTGRSVGMIRAKNEKM